MSPAVSEVATGGRCQQVAEWVLTGSAAQVEQVGPQGRPGGFSGESGEYWSAWSSSATILGPTSCSAATWRPSV